MAFLDGDDVWLPTKTSRQVELLRHGHGDLVGADYIMTTEEGSRLPMAFVAISRHRAVGWFDARRWYSILSIPICPLYVDWSWWVNTWHTVRKCRVAEPLMKYRVRGQSLSSSVPDKRRKVALSNLSRIPTAAPDIGRDLCAI